MNIVCRVAAAQNTTLFLAAPNEKLSDLPRHPYDMEAPEACVVCKKDEGDDDTLLECEKVSPTPHCEAVNQVLMDLRNSVTILIT